jgi:hypothetical protein
MFNPTPSGFRLPFSGVQYRQNAPFSLNPTSMKFAQGYVNIFNINPIDPLMIP